GDQEPDERIQHRHAVIDERHPPSPGAEHQRQDEDGRAQHYRPARTASSSNPAQVPVVAGRPSSKATGISTSSTVAPLLGRAAPLPTSASTEPSGASSARRSSTLRPASTAAQTAVGATAATSCAAHPNPVDRRSASSSTAITAGVVPARNCTARAAASAGPL